MITLGDSFNQPVVGVKGPKVLQVLAHSTTIAVSPHSTTWARMRCGGVYKEFV